MTAIKTNRDLYCFVADLVRAQSGSALTLRAYLERLRHLGRQHAHREALSFEELTTLLRAAFDITSRADVAATDATHDAYSEWARRLDEQIRDLDDMERAGTLHDPQRYFGIDAPSGARWYNFDPSTYLECAVMGTFGGWEDGDSTGRECVPGLVAVVGDDGRSVSMDPRALDDPRVAMTHVTWATFVDFLDAGQLYE